MADKARWVREALSDLLAATLEFVETQWDYRRQRAARESMEVSDA